MASKPIQAAGGIVVRDGARALIAVVQRSKDDAWVLPRGKLKRDEKPVTGARREVIEETGHRVRVHEFLGAITYRAGGRPKVVQFWRMQADAEASHELMADIVAVEWLPLKTAVRRLSYPLEKLFLRNIGRQALRSRDGAAVAKQKRKKLKRKAKPKSKSKSATDHAKTSKKKTKAIGLRAHARRKQRMLPASAAQTERAIAAIAAVAAKPITAAKRKSILQRMLGRLAG